MNKNNVAIVMFDSAKAIEVTFPNSGGKYTYMTLRDDLEVGDKVVVDTPRSGLVVVTVTKVDADWDVDAQFSYKFIVDKVDTAQHAEIVEAVEEVKALIESERRAQARKAMVQGLGLKADLCKKISKVTSRL